MTRIAVIIFLSVLIFDLPGSAQPQGYIKEYGNAVYNGLQDNLFLKQWLVLGPLPVTGKTGQVPDPETLKNAFDPEQK